MRAILSVVVRQLSDFIAFVFASAFLLHMYLKLLIGKYIVAMHLFGTDPKAVHPDHCGRANQCRPVIQLMEHC